MKMNPELKKRLKNVGVWLAILLGLVPLVAAGFGFILPVNFSEIVYTVLGILVFLGILTNPKEGAGFGDIMDDLKKPVVDENKDEDPHI